MKARTITLEIIVALLILLWVYATLSKLLDYQSFVRQLNGSYLIKGNGKVFSILLPTMEFLIVALMVFSRTRMIGLIASFALLVIFTVYIIYILNFAPAIPCSCGGIISKLSWTEHLVFNFGFLILNFIGLILLRKQSSAPIETYI